MKSFSAHRARVWLIVALSAFLAGCGLSEGIHVSRDQGQSTSRFRYEYEAIPNALVMREDTEPRWQLGRYVFVKGSDKLLVVSRITSWSDTATKKQRKSGDIPDLQDHMLERLWITIPQGAQIGEELDLHNLGYRFLVNYDQGNIGDAQFARPFRVLGNVRLLEEAQDHITVRLRVRVTTADTTAWAVFEDNLRVPFTPEGIHARRARPDAVVYSVSRPGEMPMVNQTPMQINPDGTVTPASQPTGFDGGPSNPSTTQPAMDPAIQATGQPGELPGRWHLRNPQWEVFLQLADDNTFIQTLSRPNSTPGVVKGTWRVNSGYLVLQIKSFTIGGVNQMGARGDNAYAILQVNWVNPNTVNLDGDLPGPGAVRGGYVLRRAHFPDLQVAPAIPYQPESPGPQYVGQEAKPASTPEQAPAAP